MARLTFPVVITAFVFTNARTAAFINVSLDTRFVWEQIYQSGKLKECSKIDV
jgi:hypothetical protein